MSKKASGLGRGLGALIPEAAEAAGVTRAGALEIPLNQIKPNPYQPRLSFNETELAALAESIRAHGVLQPIVVEEGANGYTLIAGERRLRASKLAGRATIPAVVRSVGDLGRLELALIENVQRSDLSPIDTALAYRRLADEFGLTQDAIAVIAGKARATVANTMRLLDLSTEVQEEVIAGRLTEGHARALVGLPEAEQAWLARTFVRDAVTVRGAEAAASTIRDAARGKIPEKKNGAKGATATRDNDAPPSAEIAALQRELESALGTPVKVKPNGRGGQIVIDYYSNEELERLIDVMKGEA
ncbi:MAG: ParB/RepB/Spo0J family partition protein [Chloroflexi bacterium]|nr:MAG: ParB/RepB/Spo0J family partition protein [Chloroflexota bacterium]